jgi:endogenous inhibitor of DNA gyrase (YacG/DUF329 family)
MSEPSPSSAKSCPICGKPPAQDYRPFCSKRCADVDLNRWFAGVYTVPVEEGSEEADDRGRTTDDE